MDAPKKRKRWTEQDKWDRENMSTLGCKVKKSDAVAFKEYAAKLGKTSNTLLKDYVIHCITLDNDKETEP